MDEQLKKQVFDQIQDCLASLVGGSGHLVSYSMSWETFKITRNDLLAGDLTKYFFEADAYRESEFVVYDDNHQPETEHLAGSIVLDKYLKPSSDKRGRIMIEPWICFNPTMEQES